MCVYLCVLVQWRLDEDVRSCRDRMAVISEPPDGCAGIPVPVLTLEQQALLTPKLFLQLASMDIVQYNSKLWVKIDCNIKYMFIFYLTCMLTARVRYSNCQCTQRASKFILELCRSRLTFLRFTGKNLIVFQNLIRFNKGQQLSKLKSYNCYKISIWTSSDLLIFFNVQ